MHDPRVLAKFGCTPERLREIFTSRAIGSADTVITTSGTRPSPEDQVAAAQGVVSPTDKKSNEAIRKRFEERLRARVLSGVGTCLNNAKAIQAVDMAWDAPPIQKETIPLMLWAQGKLNMEQLHSSLHQADPAVARKFFKAEDGKPVLRNIPRICDVAINLVRSMVTRRHAALDALWSNLWPLLKYDPRGTDNVAMLRADALTQRVDIMSDQYNYRHFLSQSRRTMLLYAWSMIFPRSKWDRQVSWRFKRSNATDPAKKSDEVESYVTREGVDLVNPHASRIFWDLGAPIANINTNNGPKYVGYWDIVTYGTILDGDYFNTDRVTASESWLQLVQQNQIFFSYYFDPCVLQWPALGMCSDPSLVNDRSANIGVYTADMRDKGVLLTQEFELINPKKEGIGDYDADVWLRLVAAGDGTIVAAEFMPSLPACYGGINCNDGRVANESLAMELLGFSGGSADAGAATGPGGVSGFFAGVGGSIGSSLVSTSILKSLPAISLVSCGAGVEGGVVAAPAGATGGVCGDGVAGATGVSGAAVGMGGSYGLSFKRLSGSEEWLPDLLRRVAQAAQAARSVAWPLVQ